MPDCNTITARLRRARGVACCAGCARRRRHVTPAAGAARFGATTSSVAAGQEIGRLILGLLGGATGEAAEAVLRDPEVQAELQRLTMECKTRAKDGVAEFMAEWAWLIVLCSAGLVGLQYLMVILALLQVDRID